MTFLDKAKIGNKVKVNLELSKDRLSKDTIEAIQKSSLCTICDFKITDGKGIGVVLKLSNGKEQWFFEDEIDIFDENGNKIEKKKIIQENNNLINLFFKNLNYKNKNNIKDLVNPLNFMIWLIVSIKDNF